MLNIYNIKDRKEYVGEVALLTQKEWGRATTIQEINISIEKKIRKILANLENEYYCKLILLDGDKLVGFISMFENDCEEKKELKPWYATMFVKEEYRGNGYSKILNDAILKEARKRGFKKIYLKSELKNYYEKFGAEYIEELSNGEKLYYIHL